MRSTAGISLLLGTAPTGPVCNGQFHQSPNAEQITPSRSTAPSDKERVGVFFSNEYASPSLMSLRSHPPIYTNGLRSVPDDPFYLALRVHLFCSFHVRECACVSVVKAQSLLVPSVFHVREQ